MITFNAQTTITISGQKFEVVPFTCIADKTGEILFTGHLRTDAEGNHYIFKVEPRMSAKERGKVINSYKLTNKK